jgi:hypothetical protein
MMTKYEREAARRREAHILAKTSPWHLWASLAQRAGYIPPLIPGAIPPADIPRLLSAAAGMGTTESSSSLATLREHTTGGGHSLDRVKSALAFFFSLVILVSISLIIYTIATGPGFRVALISRLAH